MRQRFGFEFRLLSTLALTLLLVGALQFAFFSRQAESVLLEQAAAQARDDVVFVEQAFEFDGSDAARTQVLNRRLEAIAERDGIRYVLLVDEFGVVSAASDAGQVGMYHGGPELREAVVSRRATTKVVDEGGMRSFRYIVPVQLPTGWFALQVEQEESAIQDRLDVVKRSTAGLGVIGVGIGILLFLVLGGKSVADIHRRTLQLSSKDGLTDLDNHRSFQEALKRTLAVSRRQHSHVSLVLIDLDDFKQINDRLGHGRGDDVLRKLAGLLETGRIGDRAFRIGGDEFALILPDTGSDGAWVVCEGLWRTIESGLDGATVSIGVATSDDTGDQLDLSQHADVALYEAKRRGRNNVVSFEELGGDAVIPAEKVRAVRRLLEDCVMGTAFQPIWDLLGDRPLGFEALARPPADYDIAGPGELFAIGEMLGRTQDIDVMAWRWALERFHRTSPDALLFLNVSPFTADHGDAPIDRLVEVVESSGVSPSQIVVELTEKWSGRRDLVIQQAERLRTKGFLLALDDVGAGSGDLEMMARLPVDFIKIDLNVVKRAGSDVASRGVLYAIAAFAAHSGSQVIVEGIEDQAVLAHVRAMALDPHHPLVVRGGQGYYLGMPVEGEPKTVAAPYVPLGSEARFFPRSGGDHGASRRKATTT